jgi:glycosyltransferase involved in cell wall biosynthesis
LENIAVVIPAYRPDGTLLKVASALATAGFQAIIVIDDGSGPAFRPLFDSLRGVTNIRVLRHAVNLGKGAALKTGMNYALVEFPHIAGVVTADADGQHAPEDIVKVAQAFAASPDALVMGSRAFAGAVPLRSRLGNLLTRRAMKLLVGQSLTDTQSGLRAVPRALIERLLRVPASGYEFELEMLIAARHLGTPVREQPIRTIYEPGNPSSHFQPLRDSMRIYFVLLRFTLISLTTAGLDNAAFYLFFHATGLVATSLIGARILALIFNYSLVRRAVFHSQERHRVVLPRYLALGALYMCVSYGLITFLSSILTVGVVPAKMMAETFLFIANFAIQRDFVFARRRT